MTDSRTAPVAPATPAANPASTQKNGNFSDQQSRDSVKEAGAEASRPATAK